MFEVVLFVYYNIFLSELISDFIRTMPPPKWNLLMTCSVTQLCQIQKNRVKIEIKLVETQSKYLKLFFLSFNVAVLKLFCLCSDLHYKYIVTASHKI